MMLKEHSVGHICPLSLCFLIYTSGQWLVFLGVERRWKQQWKALCWCQGECLMNSRYGNTFQWPLSPRALCWRPAPWAGGSHEAGRESAVQWLKEQPSQHREEMRRGPTFKEATDGRSSRSHEKTQERASLVTKGLRLRTSKAGGSGSHPGQGTKIPHTPWHKKKKKKPRRRSLKAQAKKQVGLFFTNISG